MIKSITEKPEVVELDLTGPDGNAFVLLGYASKFSRQLGLDSNKVRMEMTIGDYEHLIKVFEKYFGKYVILYR